MNIYACNHAGIYEVAEAKCVDTFHDINYAVSLKAGSRTDWLVLDWVDLIQNRSEFRVGLEQYVVCAQSRTRSGIVITSYGYV